jgi:hypothetical protein
MTPRYEVQIVRPQDGRVVLWDKYTDRAKAESIAATLRKHGIFAQIRRVDEEQPEHHNERRRFLVWAVLAGFAKPERLTERIVAEVENEATS